MPSTDFPGTPQLLDNMDFPGYHGAAFSFMAKGD